jgi:hypothetical protein
MVNFFTDMQSRFNTAMAPQNQTNNFYDFMAKEYGLTEDGELNLSLDLGNKEDAPKLIEAIFKYNNQEPTQGAITQMMNNPGFIMGLSLMNQAAGGKGVGEALLPAAQTTQGFMANQELTKQNKKLMRMKETGQVMAISKDVSQLATEAKGREVSDANIDSIFASIRNIDAKTKGQKISNQDNEKRIELQNQAVDYLQNSGLYRPDEISAFKQTGVVPVLRGDNVPVSTEQRAETIKIIDTFNLYDDNNVLAAVVDAIPGFDGTAEDIRNKDSLFKEAIVRQATELAQRKAIASGNPNNIVITKDVVQEAQALVLQDKDLVKNIYGAAEVKTGEAANPSLMSAIPNFFDWVISGVKGTEAKALGGAVQAGQPYLVGEEGPEVMVPNQSGNIVSNPATKGGYTWENAIIDNSPELKRIAQSSGVAEAKKALKKFRPDLYV